ncbi:hypothetical protein FC15_GL001570 [Lapidilactobacillus concavus DSM 17758]|uniref:DUF2922 domain-containing protein n=1 Tax=Lapidilactobacillus concavus DSM 17758 TaxID=1423735 RepID=A0A0R1VVW7_9LACO|nr:DUF2922 domain-containing protein [Lapidilactobacillus concavus]KRM09889.1 hypothetical protein FC15_GL001570 [Lapidilactobacillus concavus DSM 17758]GEL13933.1 hypothetical protein LCO01nite_14820 [Lapidilactobacillus concavus]
MADQEAKLTEVLVLTFRDLKEDKDRRLRIPNPREDLTGAEIKDAMDVVSDSKFIWDGVTPKSAKVVKTVTDSYDITAE